MIDIAYLKEKILDCPWEQFEEIIRKAIGSDFIWKIRPGDTAANRVAVMESIERMLREHNGSFPEKGICSSSQKKGSQLPRKAKHRISLPFPQMIATYRAGYQKPNRSGFRYT